MKTTILKAEGCPDIISIASNISIKRILRVKENHACFFMLYTPVFMIT
jgi:hypothetical protein